MKDKKETKKLTDLERTDTRSIAHATPFQMMQRFAGDMERLFEDFEGFRFPSHFGGELFPVARVFGEAGWAPQIEVHHTKGQLTLRADLPGLKRDDIKVDVTDDTLTISGERKDEKEEKGEGYYRTERKYGKFFRQIPLPEGAKTDTATATFNEGVLEIALQVPERELLARRVEIKHAEEPLKAKAAAK